MNDAVGAIVLAAGFSKRFGNNKLLAKLANGNTVIAQTTLRINAALANSVVVTRPELAPMLSAYDIELRVFDHAERGMGATLAYAIDFAQTWSGCLVCLADMPFITASTYQVLAAQIADDSIVIPTFQSHQGNPVGFGRHWFPKLAELDGDSGGRSLVKANPQSVIYFPVDDQAVLNDIDTAEDLERFQSPA